MTFLMFATSSINIQERSFEVNQSSCWCSHTSLEELHQGIASYQTQQSQHEQAQAKLQKCRRETSLSYRQSKCV